MTNDAHQVEFDGHSYTSNEILPALSSKTDYVAPASGSISYHCTRHKGETGSIIVRPVVPMPPSPYYLSRYS